MTNVSILDCPEKTKNLITKTTSFFDRYSDQLRNTLRYGACGIVFGDKEHFITSILHEGIENIKVGTRIKKTIFDPKLQAQVIDPQKSGMIKKKSPIIPHSKKIEFEVETDAGETHIFRIWQIGLLPRVEYQSKDGEILSYHEFTRSGNTYSHTKSLTNNINNRSQADEKHEAITPQQARADIIRAISHDIAEALLPEGDIVAGAKSPIQVEEEKFTLHKMIDSFSDFTDGEKNTLKEINDYQKTSLFKLREKMDGISDAISFYENKSSYSNPDLIIFDLFLNNFQNFLGHVILDNGEEKLVTDLPSFNQFISENRLKIEKIIRYFQSKIGLFHHNKGFISVYSEQCKDSYGLDQLFQSIEDNRKIITQKTSYRH